MMLLSLHFMAIIPELVPHQHHSVSNHDTCFVSLMGDTSRPSYNGSLPININSLSRKLTYKLPLVHWGLHTSKESFLNLNNRSSSLNFDQKILYGVWLQLIHSHHMDCTIVPWETLTSSMVSLASLKNLHHWSVIRWCLPCSTPAHSFTWLDSYIAWSSVWDRIPHF